MSVEIDHIALANVNHAAMVYLLKSEDGHSEWVAIAAFYKAVQIAEAALAHTKARHSNSHNSRAKDLKLLGNNILVRHYGSLWTMSCIARYLSHDGTSFPTFEDYISSRFPDNGRTAVDKVMAVVRRKLHGFECEIVSHLSDTSKKDLVRFERP